MRKNEDEILKYLSELMTEDERAGFEKEILNSAALNEELNEVKRTLEDFSLPEEILDDRYFAAMLPKVRKKLAKVNEPSFLQRIYYLVPTVAAAIIGLMFLFKPASNFDMHYEQLASQVVNNLSDQEVSQKYFDDADVDAASLETADDNNDLSSLVPSSVEMNDQIATQYLNGSVVEDYSSLHGLSDTELKQIADNLNSINVK